MRLQTNQIPHNDNDACRTSECTSNTATSENRSGNLNLSLPRHNLSMPNGPKQGKAVDRLIQWFTKDGAFNLEVLAKIIYPSTYVASLWCAPAAFIHLGSLVPFFNGCCCKGSPAHCWKSERLSPKIEGYSANVDSCVPNSESSTTLPEVWWTTNLQARPQSAPSHLFADEFMPMLDHNIRCKPLLIEYH